MKKTIEFACSHNHGRSPLAEAFAKQYFSQIGTVNYDAISSGTHVNEINGMLDGKEIPLGEAKWIIEIGMKRDLFSGNEKALEGLLQADPDALSHEAKAMIQRSAHEALKQFVTEEHGYRDVAFEQFNLDSPKSMHDQTIVNPGTVLFLGMGKKNFEVATALYQETARKPVIETLAGYATGNPGMEFKSGFGGSLNDYLDMAEVIRGYTQKAIERAVSELS